MPDPKIIERIKKLLRMSQDVSSEHEAEIATRRLHSMLAKYNLSMTDISENEEEIGEDRVEQTSWPWKRLIFQGVAELYFCSAYYIPTRKNYCKYVVMGSVVNRMTTMHIVERILEMLEKEARRESKETYGSIRSQFVTSYLNAAAKRVYYRCMQMIDLEKKGQLKDTEGETLPVLASLYDQWKSQLEKEMEDLGLIQRNTHMSQHDRLGSSKGDQAGQRVSLNTSLHQQAVPKMLR